MPKGDLHFDVARTEGKPDQGDMRFALDGREKSAFSYDPGTDRLTYQSGRLSVGKHGARVTATDAAGNDTTKTWTFKVVRR